MKTKYVVGIIILALIVAGFIPLWKTRVYRDNITGEEEYDKMSTFTYLIDVLSGAKKRREIN